MITAATEGGEGKAAARSRAAKAYLNGLTSYLRDGDATATRFAFQGRREVIWQTYGCALHTRIIAY